MSETFLSEIADQLRGQAPVAEVTPVETQAAEPTVTTEAAPENTAPPVSTESAPADLQEWWQKDSSEPQPVETKVVEPTTAVEKPNNQIELDDDLRLIVEYKKSGKSLKDFVNEYKIEDVASLSDEDVVKGGLKEFMQLSDEEYEQATYEFSNASIFQKKQWAESFRQQFAKKNEEKLKQLTSSNLQQTEYQKAVADKYNTEIDSFSKEIVGKELYGLKITDEMSSNLKNFIDKEFTMQKEDGSFDVEKIYSIGLWLKYGKDLVKANVTKAKNEGREQVIREVSNPSKNMTGGGRSVGSGLESAAEAFNTLFPG
jgi:hypothetical protein